MDILEYAMKMEKDGEAYYRELAAKTKEPGLATIFNFLADAEVAHYEVLGELINGRPAEHQIVIKSQVLNIFGQLAEAGRAAADESAHAEMYRHAQQLEAKSRDYYLEMRDNVDSTQGRALLDSLAKEEQAHYDILETIVEFVSRADPGNWLEDAEWYHTEEY